MVERGFGTDRQRFTPFVNHRKRKASYFREGWRFWYLIRVGHPARCWKRRRDREGNPLIYDAINSNPIGMFVVDGRVAYSKSNLRSGARIAAWNVRTWY